MLRPATAESYSQRLDRVLLHILENLELPLTVYRLADIACLSPFHFHRIFSAHLGETVSGYVRRMRLEVAAAKLASGGESVTDTALDVGYETPAAFARAFRERFGMTPSEFRNRESEKILQAGNLLAGEVAAMKPEMREFPETKVIYVRKNGAYSEAASAAWPVVIPFAFRKRLMSREALMIGIGYDDPNITEAEKLRYDACITVQGEVEPEGEVKVQTIAGGRYAVFLHKGPYEGLNQAYRSIFAGWVPANGCTLRDCPCFEVYLNRDPRRTKPENLRTEIWVPVE